MINYNNERLPLMIVNKKDKERMCKQIERVSNKYETIEQVKAEYIDLSEVEEVGKKTKEEREEKTMDREEEVIMENAGMEKEDVKDKDKDGSKSGAKHSRDQNTKGSSNKNTKNEEIMKQIKNSLDDNLKVMFNFSYENFLSKESETESKKSSEQEILITESYEA